MLTKKQLLDLNNLPSIIDDYINHYFIINNIDISDYKTKVNLKHNTINHLLRCIYKDLFFNNSYSPYEHNSIIDLSNNDLLLCLANKFLDICADYNKSLGLLSFGYMIGVDAQTLGEWISPEGEKLNPTRAAILQNVREGHKLQHISLMNDSGLGLLAVANNDEETGLKWAEKQQRAADNTTVFLLPSERVDRLRIESAKTSAPQGNEV